MITFKRLSIPDVVLIQPQVFKDDRGFFFESFNQNEFEKAINRNVTFVQDNHSRSSKGVLRGLHFQKTKPQGKLVRVVRGAVFDVAVDLRKSSKTFGQWEGVELSEENKKQFWIPPGYAHGFVVLSETVDFEYKCTDYYDSSDEGSILWSDPALDISWPVDNPILSDKDASAKRLADLKR